MGRAAGWIGHGGREGQGEDDLADRGFLEREIGLLSSGDVETVVL